MPKVTLKAGQRHTHDGKAVKPGDTIELDDAQVRQFGAKFDVVKEKQPEPLRAADAQTQEDIVVDQKNQAQAAPEPTARRSRRSEGEAQQ